MAVARYAVVIVTYNRERLLRSALKMWEIRQLRPTAS